MRQDTEMTPMNVIIAGRTYPLKIQNGEENTVREAVEMVNNKLSTFRTSYEGKDMQDYMAMLLTNYAVEWIKNRNQHESGLAALEHKLNELETTLSL